MAKKAPPKKAAKKKATKAAKPKDKFSSRKRKKGTYYDRNWKAMRTYQQQRRADIKAGKIKPETGTRKPKKKYKNEKERAEYKAEWHRNKMEQQRQKEIEEFLKEFPIPKL